MRARGGAVDFVGQHDIGEDRAVAVDEFAGRGVKQAAAGDVAGEQVGGELDPAEIAADAFGQGLRHQRLADAGHVFDQQMLAGQERDDAQPHDFGLAQHDLGHIGFQFGHAALDFGGHQGLSLARGEEIRVDNRGGGFFAPPCRTMYTNVSGEQTKRATGIGRATI